jgi:solute carrier family 35 (GDP-fucose transporter), member C1
VTRFRRSDTFAITDGLCVSLIRHHNSPHSLITGHDACRNKAVLTSSPDLPLLYLFNQLVIAVVLLHVAAFLTSKVEIPKFQFSTARKLIPVVSVNIIGLVFNTLCLRGVEASFFQIARGLVLPFTIAVSCMHTHARPSTGVLLSALIVTVGFLAGVTPNSSVPTSAKPSIVSLIYGVLSSVFIAVHAVLIKSSLVYCNNSTIQLAYWTNLGSALMLGPFVILNGEISAIMWMMSSSDWDVKTFAWGSVTTGVFGFLLCVAGLLSIKITSPITHMFSSVSVLLDHIFFPSVTYVLCHALNLRRLAQSCKRCSVSGCLVM